MNPQAPGGLPHDVRGLMPFHTPWWEYVLYGLAVVAVAGALLLLSRFLLRRRAAGEVAALDPWVGLTHRFRQLTVPVPFGTRAQEDYFYALSLLVREGIELRTEIPATDRTLKELRDPLRKKLPLAPKDVEAVLQFLERADLVKFAGAPSDQAEAEACHAAAGRWLASLKPQHAEDHPFGALPDGLAEAPHEVR